MGLPSIKVLASLAATIILTGCAVGRSELNIQAPTPHPSTTTNKDVFISSVIDKRTFLVKPPSPDIPSLDPSGDKSDSVQSRAIGRKRNGYGMALGDLILQGDETVQSITQKSIQAALTEKGYNVLRNRDQITESTYVIDANINKFWAWMNPGFMTITLSSEISTDLVIQSAGQTETKQISVKAADSFAAATESNWTEIIQKSIQLYVDALKSKLD